MRSPGVTAGLLPHSPPYPPRRWAAAAGLAVALHLAMFWRVPDAPQGSAVAGGEVEDPGAAAVPAVPATSVLELSLSKAAPEASAAPVKPAMAIAAADAEGGVIPAVEGSQQTAAGRQQYYARLRAHLQRFRRVPPDAAQQQGRAVVAFSVAADGSVAAVRLVRSAGNPALDAEALALIRRAEPLPSPPGAQRLQLSVPIQFE